MNKITGHVYKNLQHISKVLPGDMYAYKDRATMTGKDLKLAGHDLKMEEEIEEDKEYTLTLPGFNQVNHFRRIRHAFASGGWDAVEAYLRKYNFTLKPKQ